jgi:hypothetical protein
MARRLRRGVATAAVFAAAAGFCAATFAEPLQAGDPRLAAQVAFVRWHSDHSRTIYLEQKMAEAIESEDAAWFATAAADAANHTLPVIASLSQTQRGSNRKLLAPYRRGKSLTPDEETKLVIQLNSCHLASITLSMTAWEIDQELKVEKKGRGKTSKTASANAAHKLPKIRALLRPEVLEVYEEQIRRCELVYKIPFTRRALR